MKVYLSMRKVRLAFDGLLSPLPRPLPKLGRGLGIIAVVIARFT
jgi:hypothetical protein